MQKIKIAVIVLLVLLYVSTYRLNCFTYQLGHANIFHLMCNCWCVWSVVNDRLVHRYLIVPLLYFIGVIAYLVVCPAVEVVGCSGGLLAMSGLNIALLPSRRNWVCVCVVFVVWWFVPVVSFWIHAVGFVLGVLIGFAIIWSKGVKLHKNKI